MLEHGSKYKQSHPKFDAPTEMKLVRWGLCVRTNLLFFFQEFCICKRKLNKFVC